MTNKLIPFTQEELDAITRSMLMQVAETICRSIVHSPFTAKDIDFICSFSKGRTLRILNKCLDWDGKWGGPPFRDLALISRACGFRIDFEMEPSPFPRDLVNDDDDANEHELIQITAEDHNAVKLG